MKTALLLMSAILHVSVMALAHQKKFECRSNPAAIVSETPDFDEFQITGQILIESRNLNSVDDVTSKPLDDVIISLRSVHLTFITDNKRNAFYDKILPKINLATENGNSISNGLKYFFFDGLDYRYELWLPRNFNGTVQSEISIFNGSYISTEKLNCVIN